jgi:hypothetical protein
LGLGVSNIKSGTRQNACPAAAPARFDAKVEVDRESDRGLTIVVSRIRFRLIWARSHSSMRSLLYILHASWKADCQFRRRRVIRNTNSWSLSKQNCQAFEKYRALAVTPGNSVKASSIVVGLGIVNIKSASCKMLFFVISNRHKAARRSWNSAERSGTHFFP